MKHRCPQRQQSHNMAKLFLHFYPAPPQGYGISVKCEEPIDEPTVPVWLLNHHPNFKYFTLFVHGTELRTNRRTDDPITRCPPRTFQAGGHKNYGSGLYECVKLEVGARIMIQGFHCPVVVRTMNQIFSVHSTFIVIFSCMCTS